MVMKAIEAENITKAYKLYASPRDRLREILWLKKKTFHRIFLALSNVSLKVNRGQTIGIIGENGSGKSTFLQVICGVLQPTEGVVHVHGRIAALLELGAGFNPEFTGRENVYINGALKGFNRKEMDQRFPEIEAFAEIGEFIDQPVKTYSSGMYVRLAFSAAINIQPDILVVDEALSVGDLYFQHRCVSKMESFKQEGKTILIATHDMNLIKSFCDSAVLLHEGKVIAEGDPESVTEQYFMITRRKQVQYAASTFQVRDKSQEGHLDAKIWFGSDAGKILNVLVLDGNYKETSAFLAGDTIVLRVHVQVDPNVQKPNVGFILRDQRGYNIYGTDLDKLKKKISLRENNEAVVDFILAPTLAPGTYSFVIRLEEFIARKSNMLIDKQVGVGVFRVIENKTKFFGVADLRAEARQITRGLDQGHD